MMCVFWLHLYFVLDIINALFGQTNFELNAFNHHYSLHADEILLRIFLCSQIYTLNNFLNHEAHLELLELVTIVHSHRTES